MNKFLWGWFIGFVVGYAFVCVSVYSEGYTWRLVPKEEEE